MNGTLKILSAALVNNGTGVWNVGQINCTGTALFSNTPAATLDLAADGTLMSLTGGNALLANAGALRKTAGVGTTILTLPCANCRHHPNQQWYLESSAIPLSKTPARRC